MKRPIVLIKTFALLVALGVSGVFAQSETKQTPETSFEVILQVVGAAKDGRTDVPSSLSNAVKRLKPHYDLSDFRLEATYIERTSNSIEYKGPQSKGAPAERRAWMSFFEWGIRNVRRSGDGGSAVAIDGFIAGYRVPLGSPSLYEWYGVNSSRFRLPEGEPTLVASLAGENPGEMVFLFLTVKGVD
jgi:hypothetical protein